MGKDLKRIAIALENTVMQLRRRNDQAEAFYREALDVLTQAKSADPGPCPNPGPATSSGTYEVRPCQLRAGHAGLHEDGDGLSWTSRTLRPEEP